jgi:hypothetical protein
VEPEVFMGPNKKEIVKASKQIGLTDSQIDNLWHALEEARKNKRKSLFLNALLYFGAIIVFLSMTWFYTAHLESSYSLVISTVYALVFFSTGFYLWYAKKLKLPGGTLCSLGIIMIPLVIYSLQNTLNWWPASSNEYIGFTRAAHGSWLPVEICTLVITCLILYFVRFPFITALLYINLSFISADAIYLFSDPNSKEYLYYCIASIAIGGFLNVLAFLLYKKDRKDFGFWAYLVGMLFFWGGLTCWDMDTEWEYFLYFLINFACILSSSFFHRKIFIVFGSLGIIYYISHLANKFADSLIFSYAIGAIGFLMIILATFLIHSRKKPSIK